jgi:LEA14-like dessication related protein
MKRELIALAVVLLAFLAYSVKKAFDYTWSIRKLKFFKFQSREISGIIEIDIYNPAPIGATVREYHLDLFVNGIFVTTLHGLGPYKLIENQSTTIDINFSLFNLPNLAALVGPSIVINKATNIKFSGPIVIQMAGITTNVNFTFERPLSYYLS